MFVTSTGIGFSFINRPNPYCILTISAKYTDDLTPKKKNISIFLKPNIQILQSSYTCHITTIHLFPASLQGQSAVYVCTFFVILVIIGSLFLADGSLKQHHMTSKYFINGSQNKSVYSSPLPPFFF